MRYMILYAKHGYSLVTYRRTADEADALARRLRAAGYVVDVWEVLPDGSARQCH